MPADLPNTAEAPPAAPAEPAAPADPAASAPDPAAAGGPRRFLGQVAAFMTIQLLLLIAAMWGYQRPSDSYLALSIDKHQRLESAPDPRLILVGDSNLAFSLQSPMIEEQLGLHPVNMALNGGLSLHYILNEVRPSIRQGDIILFSTAIVVDVTPVIPTIFFQMVESNPRGILYEDWSNYPVLLDKSHYYLAMIIRRQLAAKLLHIPPPTSPVYNRRSANEYGDMTVHYTLPQATDYRPAYVMSTDMDFDRWASRVVPVLNEFDAYCRARGATFYLVTPAIEASFFSLNEPFIRGRLAARAKGATARQITRQEDFIYPLSGMFDSQHHFDFPTSKRRTQRLIDRLVVAMREDGILPPRLPPAPTEELPPLDAPAASPAAE